MVDTEVTLWPQSRHEVVMLLGKDAEIEPRQVVWKRFGRQERQTGDRRKESVSGRRRGAGELGRTGGRRCTRVVKGKGGQGSQGKWISKTRHFPNDK